MIAKFEAFNLKFYLIDSALKMLRVALLLALTFAIALGRIFDLAYVLPDGAQAILSAPLQTSFTCDNRPYGYYADVSNNCQVFQVCLPVKDNAGIVVETAQFTFLCSNQTIFSQANLTCIGTDEAMPCSDSEKFYDTSNSQLGVIPDTNQKN